MASQRPSSSTSEVSNERKRDNSSSPRWEYEVFLSFYGKDTRRGFTDHLHADLKRKGIIVFRDDETLQQGEYISQALLKAIQQSQYAIVILSANYASSKWCLMELAEIVEWKKKTKLITIIPIFYHVDPSDVRNQRGTFAEAFAAYENIKEIDMWRNAFREVGTIVGEHINGDKYESTIIQKVCGRISHELNSRSSRHDYSELVAIDSHVDEMMKLLNMESNDVRFIGIHGMGGIGKTTLAEVIYDRVSCRFEGSSFIYFKESRARGLDSVQKQLLRMIIDEKLDVWDHRNGSEVIRRRFRNKKVFIVLDDVDSDKQLTALAGDRKWFGPGSRVIITCRDSHLLIKNRVNDIYKVQLLGTADALQLFSLSAFDKTHPPENYKDLSMDFVNYAKGLPLALKVLGSFLFRRTIDAWKSARDQLEAIPKKEIFDILKISFDGLEESQQKLFLDVACFPRRNLALFDEFNEIDIHPAIDIEVLIDKSLISKSEYGCLYMHDLLEDMGREIVRREYPDEPGRRSRLFREEDVFGVLEKDTGTDAIEVIVVSLFYTSGFHIIDAEALSKMRKLRILLIDEFVPIRWLGNPLEYMTSDKLRFLHWSACPSTSWQSSLKSDTETNAIEGIALDFCPTKARALQKRGPPLRGSVKSRIITLKWRKSLETQYRQIYPTKARALQERWPPRRGSLKRRIITLKWRKSLETQFRQIYPSPTIKWSGNPLKHMPSEKLQYLHWYNCASKSWPSSFQPKNLVVLSMPGSHFKRLWEGLMVLDNLKCLDLSHSENLIETPNLSKAPKIEKINFSGCISLSKVHSSIKYLKRLQELRMFGTGIKKLWKGLAVLDNLKFLDLSDSKNLIEIPDLSGAPKLEKIYVAGCTSRLCKVHPSIGSLKQLKDLNLNECLTELLIPAKFYLPSSFMSFSSLRELSLRDCKNISTFPSVISSLSSLESLYLAGWLRLEKFPDLSRLECLKELQAYGTAITKIPPVNLIPKNIHSLKIEGQKRMPRKSRYLAKFINTCSWPKQSSYPTNHDIGSPVEYEMKEKLEVQIQFDKKLVFIKRWSMGSRIPEWVHNKSNGSSLQIELDGNTMSVMGIAIFIVCQFHSIAPVNFKGKEMVTFPICLDDDTPENYFCHFEFALSTGVSFDKPSVLSGYLWNPGYLESWKLKSLDKRKISTTAELMGFDGQTPFMELEVKEWGLHLVCPDDGALGFGSDLDSFVNFINLVLETPHDKKQRLDSSGVPLKV